jgi:hypothetical protein
MQSYRSLIVLSISACLVASCGSEPQPPAEPLPASRAEAVATPAAPPPASTSTGTYQVTGFVFEDKNKNGAYDPSDGRMGQQTITLEGPVTEKQVQVVTTGADGSFRIEKLPAGEYRITLRIPAGFERAIDDSFLITVGADSATSVQFGLKAL